MKEKLQLDAITKMDDLEEDALKNVQKRLDEIKVEEERQVALAVKPSDTWFQTLNLAIDEYPDLQLTPEEQRRVHKSARLTRTGLASQVPMTCPTRERCPFAKGWQNGGGHCEYAKLRKEPIGKPCIVEMDLIAYKTKEYADQFEVGSTPEEATDRLQCMELAEYDVYERRVTLLLGGKERSDLTEENVIGVDEAENPIYARQIALPWHLKIQIKNRRDRVLQQMVATRREKYKRAAAMGKLEEGDANLGFAGVMGKFERLQKEGVIDINVFEENE